MVKPSEDEEFRQRVFESSPMPIIVMDGETHHYIDCNTAAVRIYGFPSREETIGKTPMDVSAPFQYDGSPSMEKSLFFIEKAIREGSTIFEWKHLRTDGTVWDAEVHLLSFRIKNRQLLQFSLIDITERKFTERMQSMVHDLILDLNSCSDLHAGLDKVLLAVMQFECLDCGGIYIVDPVDLSLRVAAHHGLSEEFVALVAHVPRDTPKARLAFAGEVRYGTYTDICPEGDPTHVKEGLRAFGLIPIMAQGHLVALLNLSSHTHDSIAPVIRNAVETIAFQVGGSLLRLYTEEVGRKSEERLSAFMASASDGFYILDSQLNFVEINRSALVMMGLQREDVIGKNITDIVPDVKTSGRFDRHQEVIRTGKPYVIDHFIPHPKFGHRHFVLTSFKVGDGLGVITHDITNLIRTEEELRRKELELRILMNNLPNIIVQYDHRKRITFINKRVTGVMPVPDEYYGKTIEELNLPPDIAADMVATTQKAIEGRMPVESFFTLATSSGPRHFETVTIPEFNKNGELDSVIAISQDFTERKQTEEALRQSDARFKTLFMAISDGFYLAETLYDEAGKPVDYRYLEVNPGFERILGLDRAAIIGRRYRELVPVDTTQWLDNYFRVALTGVSSTFSFHSAEYEKQFETLAYKTAGNEVAVFVRDVTERKRTEAALQNMQKLESLGLLAGGIAHDFNNLLGGIFGYLDLAVTAVKDKAVIGYLAKALGTIDRARGLTQQLLTFAKGGVPIKKLSSFSPFIQESVQFALSGSKCSSSFSIPPDVWVGEFDRNQIGQVIDNIVINGQQAMPLGGNIRVAVENVKLAEKGHATLPAGAYVRISIADQGIGMPKEILPRIFDPFFTTKPKGHGLGLATCHSIISRHGGCIEVESEPGKGSTFHIFLPALPAAKEPGAGGLSVSFRGSGVIVIMDDEEVIRDIIMKMLNTFGYSVICTSNGSEALDVFRSEKKAGHPVAGMIFDLTIPGGTGGMEVIGEIRKTDRDIPVFVASGYADDPVMAHPSDYGFTASICKPFKRTELAEMLGRHIAAGKQTVAAGEAIFRAAGSPHPNPDQPD